VRNQEAARYARWAAIAAGLVALIVVGFYMARAIRAARRHATPAEVSASVQQQMHTFTYNGMEGDRTVFTIRASRATEFKAGSPALLEDVWISIYGREGDRNDSIHTRECSYSQKTGGVQCKGQVTIDIRPAKSQSGAPAGAAVHITTSNITFDGQTGAAESPAPVEFWLPQGRGSGVGVSYNTRAGVVRVEHDVKFDMTRDQRTGGVPMSLEAASLEVRRNDRKVFLTGPVVVRQGDRELSAGNVAVALGENLHARQLVAKGNPTIRILRGADLLQASAATLTADLSSEGWVEHLTADGNVAGSRQSPNVSSHFSSDRAEFSMEPTRNILREMIATGNVIAQTEQGGVSQMSKSTVLRLNFARAKETDPQHIQTAETLGPSTIVLKDAHETTEVRAPKFDAQFTHAGRLEELTGGTGVTIRHTSGDSPAQVSTARTLTASLGPDGQWKVVDESGDVTFREGDRQAFAQRAEIDRSTGEIRLSGSPVIEDSLSRTSAGSVTLAQKSGEFAADGGVVTTYIAANRNTSSESGTEPMHIAAASLSGSASSGRVVYSGNARLWQGDSLLEAVKIAISRDQKTLRATGQVTAVLTQASEPGILPASGSKKSPPMLWKVYAPELTYSGEEGQIRLAGGVRIVSGDVSLAARTLDLELAGGKSGLTAGDTPLGGGLTRAVARGDVIVRQGGLWATAEGAVYTVAGGKFVLSGGKPTITDASGNSASGRSLTFFLPNDTILIDSREGSRTLTKYRVEK
jgi:LPS export ABC transporter protein LptC